MGTSTEVQDIVCSTRKRVVAHYDEDNERIEINDLNRTEKSADVPLGLPFNIASYAALLMIVAQKLNFSIGDFIWSGGDVHVYSNQIELFKGQIERPLVNELPQLFISGVGSPDNWDNVEDLDITVLNYHPHEEIKYPPAAV